MTQLIRDPDGRRLSVESTGDPEGKPVFLLHGTPGGRLGPRPRGIVLYRLGIRLISFDRPGYPGSDRHRGRNVAAAAGNVRVIADYLGIDRFSVVGRSGGGPHALACAALLPDRVASAAALGSLAPCDAADLDWNAGMTESNVQAYRTAKADPPDVLRAILQRRAARVSKDSEGLLRILWPEMSAHDKEIINDITLRQVVANSHVEALSNNCVDGWVDDVIALSRPWGFEPDKIVAPVKLWSGRNDVFSPVSHTYWLAQRIGGADVEIDEGKSHFGAITILPRILSWVARQATVELRQERLPYPDTAVR